MRVFPGKVAVDGFPFGYASTGLRAVVGLVFFLASAFAAAAQSPAPSTAPFDMSPERKSAPPAQTPTSPQPQAQPGAAPAQATVPAAAPAPTPALARRYLLQRPTLRLQGENAEAAWTLYLTPEQAASAAKLDLGYSNALVVAPEASTLRVAINDTTVLEQPVRGGERPQQVSVALPAGLMVPGINRIRITADQRHRTDCTIESTYELWTDVDATRSFLSFSSPAAGKMVRLDDIRAIGVDETGRSRFLLVVPALGQLDAASAVLKLSQGLSLIGDGVNTTMAVSRDLPVETRPGDVIVILATAEEFAGLKGLGRDPVAAGTARFVPLAGQGAGSALAFVGADWRSVSALIDNFVSMAGKSGGAGRSMLKTAAWRGVDTPLVTGPASLSFASLGRGGEEFSGRRFVSDFTIGIPEDFYANAYGSATILLDAAYTGQVMPGSRINVTVNGNLATTVPITASGGAVLSHYPIRVSMRHFRPGVNVIGLEAMLTTQADRACAPGASADRTPRFALFDTSRFVMPDFAHLSRAPNLAATTGLGFPYAGAAGPAAVVLARQDAPTLSTAATVFGKLAGAAGQPFGFELVPSPANAKGRNALYIGATGDLPAGLLTGLAPASAADGQDSAGVISDVNVDSWQQKVDSGTVLDTLRRVNGWMKETFNLDLAAVSLLPRADAPFDLPRDADLFVSQVLDRDSASVHTVIGAPDAERLQAAARTLAERSNWEAIDGRVSYYDAGDDAMKSVPAGDAGLIAFPKSFTNIRLVVANWLSGNFLIYAIGLVLSATALGIASSVLLSRLGRGNGEA